MKIRLYALLLSSFTSVIAMDEVNTNTSPSPSTLRITLPSDDYVNQHIKDADRLIQKINSYFTREGASILETYKHPIEWQGMKGELCFYNTLVELEQPIVLKSARVDTSPFWSPPVVLIFYTFPGQGFVVNPQLDLFLPKTHERYEIFEDSPGFVSPLSWERPKGSNGPLPTVLGSLKTTSQVREQKLPQDLDEWKEHKIPDGGVVDDTIFKGTWLDSCKGEGNFFSQEDSNDDTDL